MKQERYLLPLSPLGRMRFLSIDASACDNPPTKSQDIQMNMINLPTEAQSLNEQMASLDLAGRLSLAASLGGRVVFTTSLGIEDQVITHVIGEHRYDIDVVTLETGRLFPE